MSRYRFNTALPPRRYRRVRGTLNDEVRALPDEALESAWHVRGSTRTPPRIGCRASRALGPRCSRSPVKSSARFTGAQRGGALGGMAGNAVGQLAGEPARPTPVRPAGAGPAPAPAMTAGPGPTPQSPPDSGAAAASTELVRFLMRKEVQAALLALAAGGQLGATNAQVGNVAIPASQIASTVGLLGQRSSAAYEATYGDATSAADLDVIPGNCDATDSVSRASAVQAAFLHKDTFRGRMARARRDGRPRVASDSFAEADGGADAYESQEAPDDPWTHRHCPDDNGRPRQRGGRRFFGDPATARCIHRRSHHAQAGNDAGAAAGDRRAR